MRIEGCGGDFAQVFAARGIGKRRTQEDSFACVSRNNALFALVADGMGGMAHGAEISALIAGSMAEDFTRGALAMEPRMELIGLMNAAQEKVLDYLDSFGNGKGGSTAVAAVIKDGELCFAAAGDSRIGLVRGDRLMWLNRIDSLGLDLDDKAARGVLPLESAKKHPRRAAMTNYVGVDGVLNIDAPSFPIRLAADDIITIESDGVFGVLSDAETEDALKAADPSEAISTAVEQKQCNTQDNYTAVIIRYTGGAR